MFRQTSNIIWLFIGFLCLFSCSAPEDPDTPNGPPVSPNFLLTQVSPNTAQWGELIRLIINEGGGQEADYEVMYEQGQRTLKTRISSVAGSNLFAVLPGTLDTGITLVRVIKRGFSTANRLPIRVLSSGGPSVLYAQQSALEPKDTLLLYGRFFGLNASTNKLILTTANSFKTVSPVLVAQDSFLTAIIPENFPIGQCSARVVRLLDTSFAFSLDILPPPPQILSITPDTLFFGSSWQLTIFGENFYPIFYRNVVKFRINGREISATPDQFINTSQFKVNLPILTSPERYQAGALPVAVEVFGRKSNTIDAQLKFRDPVIETINGYFWEESQVDMRIRNSYPEYSSQYKVRLRNGPNVTQLNAFAGSYTDIYYFKLPYGLQVGTYQLSFSADNRWSAELPLIVKRSPPITREFNERPMTAGKRRFTARGRFYGKTLGDNKITGFDRSNYSNTLRNATITGLRIASTQNQFDEIDFEFEPFDFCGKWEFSLQTYGDPDLTQPVGEYTVLPTVTSICGISLPLPSSRPWLYLYPGDPVIVEGSGFSTTSPEVRFTISDSYESNWMYESNPAKFWPPQSPTVLTPTRMEFPTFPVKLYSRIGNWDFYGKPVSSEAYLSVGGCSGLSFGAIVGPLLGGYGWGVTPQEPTAGSTVSLRGRNLGRNSPNIQTMILILDNNLNGVMEIPAYPTSDPDVVTFTIPTSFRGGYRFRAKVYYAPGKYVLSEGTDGMLVK